MFRLGFRIKLLLAMLTVVALCTAVMLRVSLRRVEAADVAVDWAEVWFKDQHISRGDLWHCRQELVGGATALHVGQTLERLGARLTVHGMARNGVGVSSGVLLETSRLSFRSRSAAFFVLLQV